MIVITARYPLDHKSEFAGDIAPAPRSVLQVQHAQMDARPRKASQTAARR
jgi:hypothetical protein